MAVIGSLPVFFNINTLFSIIILFLISSHRIIRHIAKNNSVFLLFIKMLFTTFLIAIPVIGQIYFLYFLKKNYNIAKDMIKMLLPSAIFSIFIYWPLIYYFNSHYQQMGMEAFGFYMVASFALAMYVKGKSVSDEDFLLKMALGLVSIPVIGYLVTSLINSISSLFNVSPVTRMGTKTINVNSYMRGDTLVQAHTREVATAVTSLETTLSAEVAASTILAKEAGNSIQNNVQIPKVSKVGHNEHNANENVKEEKGILSQLSEPIIQDISMTTKDETALQMNITEEKNIVHESIVVNNAEKANKINEVLQVKAIDSVEYLCPFLTDKDESFFRSDDFNDKKVQKFIAEFLVKNKKDNVYLNEAEMYLFGDEYTPIAYYDETLFGSGEYGVLVTKNWLFVNVQFEKTISLRVNYISECLISGTLNKKITLKDLNGNSYSFVLTQSNKGAEKICTVIKNLINLNKSA